ncbi:MAG: type II secretion system F family protein [Candidatus Micrarchaeota archaeon]
MFNNLLEAIAQLFPKSIQNMSARLLAEADVNMPVRRYLGLMLLQAVFIGLVITIASSLFATFILALMVGFIAAIFAFVFFFTAVMLMADSRASKIEEVLPDALQMISAKIRAGMTMEQAVLLSARPEFGPLEDEIRFVSKKTFAGIPLTNALLEMGERVRSVSLKRAVFLLVEGTSLGGQMVRLLQEVAEELRTTAALKREIKNATLSYFIFIIFSSVIAAPVLFATSVYYVEMNTKLSSGISVDVEVPTEGLAGSLIGSFAGEKQPLITPQEMMSFALTCILVSTLFGSLVLGLIRHGHIKYGLKYIPLFVPTAIAIFFVCNSILAALFKSFLPPV